MGKHKHLVEIKNISKKVGQNEILAPFSYQLHAGKILALCGGNGAGKSTLIRMITGLITPTTGNIMIAGEEQRRNKRSFFNYFGYMPDDFNFQPSIRAQETIQFYANLKKIKQKRVAEVIESVGLTEHMKKKVGTFSKGMQQRLLLAQALLAEPPLLILDEPTNGLDPHWIKQFGKLMVAARERGQTVIFSTHELHVAEQIADEVVFLDSGKVISEGPIENYSDIGLHETFQQLFLTT